MQENIDDRIAKLNEDCARLRELRSELDAQNSLYRQAESGLRQLKAALDSEEEDVKRMDGAFTKFFLNVTGKYDERLDKEQREAMDARSRYTLALNELQSIETEIGAVRDKIAEIKDCEREYKAAVSEKRSMIKSSGRAEGSRISELEGKISEGEAKRRNLSDAISCAESAEGSAERALEILQSARNWGTYDVIGGGGLSDIIKHDKLSQAESELNDLKSSLSRLRAKLGGVSIYFDAEARTDSGLRFADYFFDGIFSAIAVNRHIDSTISSVTDTKNRLHSLILGMKSEKSNTEAQIDRMEKEIAEITLETRL